jgi:hypothetical protein
MVLTYPFSTDHSLWYATSYGSTVEASEYDAAKVELERIRIHSAHPDEFDVETGFKAPDGETFVRISYPSNAGSGVAATDYWGGAANIFKSDEQKARRAKFGFGNSMEASQCSLHANALVSDYISYYNSVVSTYEYHTGIVDGYKSDKAENEGYAQAVYNEILETERKKAVYEHIIKQNEDYLIIVNETIVDIENQINNLTN